MSKPVQCATCLLIALLFSSVASAKAPSDTGPWDVAKLLAMPTPMTVEKTEGNLRTITYPSEPYLGEETQVFAYYATPSTGKGPFPAMLLVHGGGGTAFAEWARLWAERGYVALAMDLAGNGPDGKRLAAGGPGQDDGTKFKALETNALTDTWPYQAVAAVLRGHALLMQQPEVDKNRIGITGISWGGYLTCIVSGIDHELKVAVPVYGCGFLADNSAWKDSHWFDQRLTPDASKKWVANFDPSHYLAGVQCPTLFVNGTNDFAYPLDSYQKSYSLVEAPKTLCISVNMPHGHHQGWAPPEIGAFVDSVLKDGQPLPTLAPLKVTQNQATSMFESSTPLKNAALHYTTDTGRWQDRKWETVPAKIEATVQSITAELPTTRSVSLFLTAVDDRGLTVSTPHVELAP